MDGEMNYEHSNDLTLDIVKLIEDNRQLRKTIGYFGKKIYEEKTQNMSLDHENFRLKHELSNVETMGESSKIEKDQLQTDRELEIIRLQRKLKKLFMKKEKTDKNNFSLIANVSDLENSTKKIESDLQSAQELIQRLSDDKLRLSQRIEKLTSNERTLVLEIERYKTRGRVNKNRVSINQTENYFRGIEDDRDYWKNEAALLRDITKKENISPDEIPTKITSKKHSSKKKVLELEKEKEELKQKLESVRKEKPVSPIREQSPSPTGRSNSQSKSDKKQGEDINQLRRERDDLRNLLNKLEKRVVEIQMSVKLLNQEKDHYCEMYEESRKEIRRMHQELISSQEAGNQEIMQMKKILNHLEEEKVALQSELNQLQNDKEKLLERFKITVEAVNHDKYLFEQKIDDLSNIIKNNSCERKDMTERMETMRSRILDLESETKSFQLTARQQESGFETEKQNSNLLRQQLKKTENHLDSSEKKISNLTNQLSKSEEKASMQDKKLLGLIEDLRIQRDDYVRLRSEANRMDEERNQLKGNLTDTTQKLLQIEHNLAAAEDELQDSRDHLSTAEQQLGRVSEMLSTSEKENRQLKKMGDHLINQMNDYQRKVAFLCRENERLTEEIKENQNLIKRIQHELRNTTEKRDDLLNKVDNCTSELKVAEKMLAQKEENQNDLLDRYETLAKEFELCKQKIEIISNDFNSCKQELVDRENDVEDFRFRAKELEKENSEKRLHNLDLDSKIRHLEHVISQDKRQIQQIRDERDEFFSDLSSLRDLCGHLELSKEELLQDIDCKNLDINHLQGNIDDLENTNDTLKEELHQTQENLRNVEVILHGSQNLEQNCMLEIHEKNSEIAILTERLQGSEEKLLHTERDMQKYKNRNNDLEREVELLQRSLANEKFEKDRALSDLRINSLSTSYKPSCYVKNETYRSSSPCRACSP